MLQAGIDYGVRVIRAYEQRRVGQVFYPPGLLRDALVKRGFVERVTPEGQAEPDLVERAESAPKRRRG